MLPPSFLFNDSFSRWRWPTAADAVLSCSSFSSNALWLCARSILGFVAFNSLRDCVAFTRLFDRVHCVLWKRIVPFVAFNLDSNSFIAWERSISIALIWLFRVRISSFKAFFSVLWRYDTSCQLSCLLHQEILAVILRLIEILMVCIAFFLDAMLMFHDAISLHCEDQIFHHRVCFDFVLRFDPCSGAGGKRLLQCHDLQCELLDGKCFRGNGGFLNLKLKRLERIGVLNFLSGWDLYSDNGTFVWHLLRDTKSIVVEIWDRKSVV